MSKITKLQRMAELMDAMASNNELNTDSVLEQHINELNDIIDTCELDNFQINLHSNSNCIQGSFTQRVYTGRGYDTCCVVRFQVTASIIGINIELKYPNDEMKYDDWVDIHCEQLQTFFTKKVKRGSLISLSIIDAGKQWLELN